MSENETQPNLINGNWLKNHIDDPEIRIVDTRTNFDYGKGHIKNSVNIELSDIVKTKDGLPAMCISRKGIEKVTSSKGIDNDTTLVAYDNFGGVFASRFLWTMEYFGHKKVGIFNGSIKSWIDEGGEFTNEVPDYKTAHFSAKPDMTRLATKEWILDHLDNNSTKFLDVRTAGEYSGNTAYGKRAGHIPGAVHIHWLDPIDPKTGKFRSNEDLRMTYQKKGIKADNEIVTYCWMGLRASHSYAILRLLGYPHVRVYDASWSEWGEIDKLPVEK